MIIFLTLILFIVQILSIAQRKGVAIDFNRTQTSLIKDLTQLIDEKSEDIKLGDVLKKMLYMSSFLHFFYFSYFSLLFVEEVITPTVFSVAIATSIFAVVFEYVLYSHMSSGKQFKKMQNTILSAVATINSLLQIAIFITVFATLLETTW